MWRQSTEAQDREYFMHRIEEMEEDLEYGTFTKEMPAPKIVKYHGNVSKDLLEKTWIKNILIMVSFFFSILVSEDRSLGKVMGMGQTAAKGGFRVVV
jgi:hypothetical protein